MKNSKKKSFLDNYDPQKIYDFKQVAKELNQLKKQ